MTDLMRSVRLVLAAIVYRLGVEHWPFGSYSRYAGANPALNPLRLYPGWQCSASGGLA
jgi:hypothetical protein